MNKFQIGDRVNAYSGVMCFDGTVTNNKWGFGCILVKIKSSIIGYKEIPFNIKQCRRVVKKKKDRASLEQKNRPSKEL
jgi:hypothetical protein